MWRQGHRCAFSLPKLIKIRPRSLSSCRKLCLSACLGLTWPFLVFAVKWRAGNWETGVGAKKTQPRGKLLNLASISVTIYFLCFGIRFSTNRKTIKLGWKPANERQRTGRTNNQKRNEARNRLLPQIVENRMPYLWDNWKWIVVNQLNQKLRLWFVANSLAFIHHKY